MKKVLATVLALVLSLGLFAAASAEDYGTYNWIAAMTVAETTTNYKMVEKFAELINERSNGSISVELYPGTPTEGELRVSLRSQSSNLILYLGQFFRLWDKIETAYLGGTDCVIQDGRYSRRLRLPEGLSDREQGAVLAGYIRAMERGLKAFFNSLEDPRQAAAAVDRAYQEYLRQYPAI